MKLRNHKNFLPPAAAGAQIILIERSKIPERFPGGPFTVRVLARWASEGRGPDYELIRNRAWYRLSDLEAIIAGESDCVRKVTSDQKATRAARAELAREREKKARIAARSAGLASSAGPRRGRPSRAEVEARLALA